MDTSSLQTEGGNTIAVNECWPVCWTTTIRTADIWTVTAFFEELSVCRGIITLFISTPWLDTVLSWTPVCTAVSTTQGSELNFDDR